jgi:hypothetical protein
LRSGARSSSSIERKLRRGWTEGGHDAIISRENFLDKARGANPAAAMRIGSMRRNAASLWLAPAFAMALVACSTKTPPVDPNRFPTDYKKEILNTLAQSLGDPTNVHDAFLSDPVLTPIGKNQRYTACVRFNARDLTRQYVGSKDRIAYFYGGRLNQLVEATPEQCGNAAYKPFPELEKLCFANKCS